MAAKSCRNRFRSCLHACLRSSHNRLVNIVHTNLPPPINMQTGSSCFRAIAWQHRCSGVHSASRLRLSTPVFNGRVFAGPMHPPRLWALISLRVTRLVARPECSVRSSTGSWKDMQMNHFSTGWVSTRITIVKSPCNNTTSRLTFPSLRALAHLSALLLQAARALLLPLPAKLRASLSIMSGSDLQALATKHFCLAEWPSCTGWTCAPWRPAPPKPWPPSQYGSA